MVESEGLENGGQGIDVLAGEDLDAPEGGALVADVAARALPCLLYTSDAADE